MKNKAKIFYFTLTDEMRKREKLDWFSENRLKDIPFETIHPDKNNNWLNLTDNDFETLLPLANKKTKLSKNINEEQTVFKMYSLGVVTNRDEWVYDFNKNNLENKVKFFCEFYENEKTRWLISTKSKKLNDFVDRTIKWTSELENHLIRKSKLKFDKKCIISSLYRPFVKRNLYFTRIIIHRIYQNELIWGLKNSFDNKQITISGTSTAKPFTLLATNLISGLDFLEKTQCLPLYRYDKKGNRIDNITDWGLEQFVNHYKSDKITKEDIFHYTYGVLHNPTYRKKYEINLKREFPRLPFYNDFWKWVKWGKELMDLHINYEKIEPYKIKIIEVEKSKEKPKVKLSAFPESGEIILDENTSISKIPDLAWKYKLGNRSALHWILDQYKEKTSRDKTITEKFNNYKFADYKETVIDLIKRVTTVSIRTMEIVNQMEIEETHKDK